MLMEKERQEIVDYGKKMFTSGLTNGTSGNISSYNAELGYMAIKPSGVDYMETVIEDIVIMDLKGNIIEGIRKPSSEHDLHANIYKKYPEVRGVVHAHSMYCTTFACMNKPIKAVHYLIAGANEATVPVVPYATYGSEQLAENVQNTHADGLAMLMENHGVVCWGPTLSKAFNVCQNVEWVAEIQWRAECIGKPVVISDKEIAHVIEEFKGYGQSDPKAKGKGGY